MRGWLIGWSEGMYVQGSEMKLEVLIVPGGSDVNAEMDNEPCYSRGFVIYHLI